MNFWVDSVWASFFSVHLVAQLTRAFERHHPFCRHNCILTGSRISHFPLLFFFVTHLPKPETKTSSPVSRAYLMIPIWASMISADGALLRNPRSVLLRYKLSCIVRVTGVPPFWRWRINFKEWFKPTKEFSSGTAISHLKCNIGYFVVNLRYFFFIANRADIGNGAQCG